MKTTILSLLAVVLISTRAVAFCGFYVAKADAKLFNNQSQIILVRDGQRSTITMANDFQGEVKDFAMVVPVPVVLQKHQIKVVSKRIFDQLDAYSAPRMVEYYDDNPCAVRILEEEMLWDMRAAPTSADIPQMEMKKAEKKGVTIEAKYEVGEYDILILSAKESNGLKEWLIENGYKIPASANQVLDPYIKNKMKFFVVKVNMDNMRNNGFDYLRPIQISFDSDRFMLPIRLGMANSNGEQDMVVYAFTRSGRVETTNYRTVKIPSDRNIPLFVQKRFGEFYKRLFKKTYESEGKKAVFLEYAWDVTPNFGVKCDPCVGPPPIFADFREAGVNWVTGNNASSKVFFTRLHVRYSREKFPQDLFFQVTPNQERHQGRYIITHHAEGDLSCAEGQEYLVNLRYRRQRELDELVSLTGWDNASRGDKYLDKYPVNQLEDKYRRNMTPVTPAPTGGNTPKGNSMIWGMALAACCLLSIFFLVFIQPGFAQLRQRV